MGNKDSQLPRWTTLLFDALIAVPLLTLLNLYSYVVRARVILGHWPAPGNPPYPVGFGFQSILVPLGAMASFESLVLAGLLVLWLALRGSDRHVLTSRPVATRILVFAIVWLAFFLLFRLDPGRFIAWIWD